MFREGEGRELVRLLREAEKEADEREKTAQEEAINCNLKIEIRNKLKVSLKTGHYILIFLYSIFRTVILDPNYQTGDMLSAKTNSKK